MLSMADSPTRRVKRYAESMGWIWGNVETRVTKFLTRDLWNWADALLLAGHGCDVGPGNPTLIAVQVTSSRNRSSRRRKMLESDTLALWLADGTRGAVLATTGVRGGQPMIRWSTFTLSDEGEIIETDQWIQGGRGVG